MRVLIQDGLEIVNAAVFAATILGYLQLAEHLEECSVIQIHYNIFRQDQISEAASVQVIHFANALLPQAAAGIAADCLVFHRVADRAPILQAAHIAGATAAPVA